MPSKVRIALFWIFIVAGYAAFWLAVNYYNKAHEFRADIPHNGGQSEIIKMFARYREQQSQEMDIVLTVGIIFSLSCLLALVGKAIMWLLRPVAGPTNV
jgi:hypothetical protein